MKCPNCKNEISTLSKKCNYCGKNIKNRAKSYEYNSCITYNELTKPRTKNSHKSQYNYNKTYKNIKIQKPQQYNYSNQYNNVQAGITHQQQYNYSTKYSNVQQNTNVSHQQQYNYSNQYSQTPPQQKNEHQDQYEYSANYSHKKNKEIMSEEYYIKAYIGENYEKIINSKYSIPTLLFGGLYFFYRKLWIYGIAWIIIASLFEFQAPILLIVNAIFATKFKEFYLHQVDKNVQFIKNNNTDKSSTEIIEICKKQGEPIKKIKPASIIVIFAFTILMFSIFSLAYKSDYNDVELDTNDIQYETYSLNNLEYTIDTNEFYEVTSTNNFREYNTNDNSCQFTIRTFPYNKTYLSNYKYSTDKVINNYTWKQIYNYYKYFITTHDNSFYEVKIISEDINCNIKVNEIMETATFKNMQYYNNGV